MRLVEILQVKRANNVFELNGCKIQAARKASDGYGVLVVFEGSQLDVDFAPAVGNNMLCWYPTAQQLTQIREQLDLSDRLTCDWLRKGEGWSKGPRPYSGGETKIAEFV